MTHVNGRLHVGETKAVFSAAGLPSVENNTSKMNDSKQQISFKMTTAKIKARLQRAQKEAKLGKNGHCRKNHVAISRKNHR